MYLWEIMSSRIKPPALPLGTHIRMLGSKAGVDKPYRGLEGLVIEYGNPASIYDHLVYLPDLERNIWTSPKEVEVIEPAKETTPCPTSSL